MSQMYLNFFTLRFICWPEGRASLRVDPERRILTDSKGKGLDAVERVKQRIGNFLNSKAFYGIDIRVRLGSFCLDNFSCPIYDF
jgi:CO dehydrogenase/acetyl-CoA synthase beta subunit